MQKYGTDGVSVIDTYHPDFLFRKQVSEDDCFFGDYPTLSQLGAQFDKKFPAAWLMLHLNDLSEFCGCKEKLQGHPLQQCASIISTEFYFLKISELMLFFHRFKSGRYGRFYGSVDPLVITTSLRDFLKERSNAYLERDKAEKEKADEEARNNAVSWEDYCMREYGEIRPHPLDRKPLVKSKPEPKDDPIEIYRMANWLTTETIETVKEAYGRVFKKKYGCTPEEYINNHRDRQRSLRASIQEEIRLYSGRVHQQS